MLAISYIPYLGLRLLVRVHLLLVMVVVLRMELWVSGIEVVSLDELTAQLPAILFWRASWKLASLLSSMSVWEDSDCRLYHASFLEERSMAD